MAPARRRALALLSLVPTTTVALVACGPAPTETVTATVEVTVEPSAAATPTGGAVADAWDVEPCRLPTVEDVGVGLGQPRNPDRLPSTGELTIAVLFVDFPDAPAASSPAERLTWLAGTEEFYSDVSYGRLDMRLEPDTAWRRMSLPSTEYSYATYESHRAFVAEAVALADATYDFSDTDGLLILASDTQVALTFGPTLTSFAGDGILADGNEMVNAVTSATDLDYWGYLWAVHELGHSLGLPDLYDYTGDNIHRHVGGFSVMGDIFGFAPEPLAYSRWQLGWIDDITVACHSGFGTEYVLAPVAGDSLGTQLVIVPVSATAAVVAEYRTPRGYDTALDERGVLVYVVDTSIPSGSGQVEVYPRKPASRAGAMLGEGESLTVEGVEIAVYELTDAQATLYAGYAGE